MVIEKILDRYAVTERLGAGGMGDVWRADDEVLGRRVAIKFVGERELRENPGARSILEDEARNAGRLLGHPNILSVLDLLQVDTPLHKGPAIVLEYVEGCNVAEWMATYRPKLNTKTAFFTSLYIASEAIEALTEAHHRDILHRDIKPQNIMVSNQGRVKVTDFGLSRLVEALTRTHTVWGRQTPLYAAPEQWDDQHPDRASDVYQLCATLYHLFTGRPANTGSTMMGLMQWHKTASLIPLRSLSPEVPEALASMIEKGLHSDRTIRPSPWELFDAVSRAIPKKSVQMTLTLDARLEHAKVEHIADLTDFDEEALSTNRRYGPVTFPHAMEAFREAIGTILLGAEARIEG